MIILYVIIAALYAALWGLSLKEHSLSPNGNAFERMAEYIFCNFRKKNMIGSREMEEGLCAIHPELGANSKIGNSLLREYYVKKISTALFLFFIGDILAICIFVSSKAESVLTEGKYIERNTYGSGSREAELLATIQDTEQEKEEGFTITIQERRYETALVQEMAGEVKALLPKMILNSNISLDEVRSSLSLINEIDGYPFQISWESDNYSIIDSDGSVINREVEGGGEIIQLTAKLTYDTYIEEMIIPVHVYPPLYSQEELLRNQIYEALIQREEEERHEEEIELPESIDGKPLVWSMKQDDSSSYLLLLIGVGAVAIYLSGDKDLQKKVAKRNRQMLSDYPQLITKLILYMEAGMTMRNAFKKIAYDYKNQKRKGGCRRYVYEEMLLACYELDSGISESAAYEHFAKRCRLPQYNKFVNLLTQNLKKGSRGLIEELRQEAQAAFEERRGLAKKLGEEAGTKLLLPMMLMLGIVMVLIMIPAYFSFSI